MYNKDEAGGNQLSWEVMAKLRPEHYIGVLEDVGWGQAECTLEPQCIEFTSA